MEKMRVLKKIYLITIWVDTNLLSSGLKLKNSDANWKAICSAENNEILWGGNLMMG